MPVLCIPPFSIPRSFASLSVTSLVAIQQEIISIAPAAIPAGVPLNIPRLREARSLSEIASEPDIPMEIDEEPSSPTDQEPGAEQGSVRHCDFCSTPLDANNRRFFRCAGCDSGPTLLCEACCFEIHLCHRNHEVQEWNRSLGNWVTGNMDTLLLGVRIAVHCGNCCVQLAEAGRGIPIGAVHCRHCDTGVLCCECCTEAHACMPLHHLQAWTGNEWELTTLRDIGFVYQMGHGGNPCEAPTTQISSLMVISDKSVPGQWLQIRRNGWFASALKHAGACVTFRVWPDVDLLD
ncbi:hypothetical protein C8F04DRAFT_1272589 [Mycena alexandri]|uniref:Uncharacterized protein n=1 Tax=Mycena alexandri TaxID=1745969 RepID=A0AAD6WVD1_9AGAR|nr:hypothetical protein C8F04DRAFT_1272589 [Mycena alexandri]